MEPWSASPNLAGALPMAIGAIIRLLRAWFSVFLLGFKDTKLGPVIKVIAPFVNIVYLMEST